MGRPVPHRRTCRVAGPLEPTPPITDVDQPGPGTCGVGRPTPAAIRALTHRSGHRRAGTNRNPDPAPPLRAAFGGLRPAHRDPDPCLPGNFEPVRARSARRTGAPGCEETRTDSEQVRGRGTGYDYVHVAIDDHTRLGYAEVLPDEKGTTSAGFLTRAAAYLTTHSIDRIERVLIDNAFAYRNSAVLKQAVEDLSAVQRFIKPRCP